MMRLIASLVAFGLMAAPVAHAQGTKAAAEAAFHKGKQLMAAGDLVAACDAFAQSETLDPQLGTLYNLALCYEQTGKIASAWLAFSEVAAKDTNAGRKADSATHAHALEGRVPKLRLETASQVPGLVVRQGDTDITVTLGVDTPIDPGHYTIAASAPGHRPWTTTIDIAPDSGAVTVTIAPLAVDEDPGRPKDIIKDDTAPPPVRSRGRHILGVSVGVAGVAALGASVVFGVQARGRQGDAEDLCGGAVASCAPNTIGAAQTSIDAARSRATYANIAAATGAVLVGVGVVLYVTAPHAERRAAMRPMVSPDQVGLVLDGRF